MTRDIRKLIETYARTHDPECFAEDAVFVHVPLAEPTTGRAAIAAMLRLFYHDAFTGANGELRHVAADPEKGLGFVEFTFRGRHTGTLMGVPPTGREVEVPMLGVYEVGSGGIDRARLYYDMATLTRQLGQRS